MKKLLLGLVAILMVVVGLFWIFGTAPDPIQDTNGPDNYNLQVINDFDIIAGDIGVTGGPYEMFDTNGMQIKESAPMAMTIICNMANGSIGYVPSQLGYDNGGYSTDITRLAPGSGEKLAQVMIDSLTQHRTAQ